MSMAALFQTGRPFPPPFPFLLFKCSFLNPPAVGMFLTSGFYLVDFYLIFCRFWFKLTAFGGLAHTWHLSAKACGPVEGSGAVNAAVVWLWMTVLSLGISEQPGGHMGHFSLLLLAYAVQSLPLPPFYTASLSGIFSIPQLSFPVDLMLHIFLVSIIQCSVQAMCDAYIQTN